MTRLALMFAAAVATLVACDTRPPGKGPANPEPPAKQSPVAHAPEKSDNGAEHGDHVALVQEDDPKAKVVLQIASKLGVKAKVDVKATEDASNVGASMWGSAWKIKPDLVEDKLLHVDQGGGLYFATPLRFVKHIVTTDKGSIVTLADGSKHHGKLSTAIVLDEPINDSDGRFYRLSRAAEVENAASIHAKPRKSKRARFTLKVAAPSDDEEAKSYARTFEVYAPKMGGRHAGDKFAIILGEETLKANPADFERIAVRSNGEEKWKITVKAPGAAEKTGDWLGANSPVLFETTSGNYVGLYPDDSLQGFTLERKSAEKK